MTQPNSSSKPVWSPIHLEDNNLYTLSDLSLWTPPKVTRIIHGGLLNFRNKMIIFGAEGSWKSMLGVHLSNCLARGSDFLHFHTSRCNVLRLQVEMPMYTDMERLDKYSEGSRLIYMARSAKTGGSAEPDDLDKAEEVARRYAWPDNIVSRTEQFIHLDELFGRKSLIKNIGTCQAYLPDLPLIVVIDPLYKVFGRNINDQENMAALLTELDRAMNDYNFTIVIIHHARKSQSVRDQYGGLSIANMGSEDATGSRYLINWADTILRVDPKLEDKTKTHVTLSFTKHRNAERVVPEFKVRWHRDSLHPEILQAISPQDDSEFQEIRGAFDYARLE